MAIPRVFDSNTPFAVVTERSSVSLLGREDGREGEDEKGSLVKAVAPHLSRAMVRGTAKHLCAERQCSSEESPCVSVIAQAEGEGSQEFTPTCMQYSYPRSQPFRRSLVSKITLISDTEDDEGADKLPHCRLHRRQRRKGRPSRQRREQGEEAPVIQGLWVQEIDWLKSLRDESAPPTEIIPPPPQFTDCDADPCCHANRLENTSWAVTQYGLNDSSSVASRCVLDFDFGDPGSSRPHKSQAGEDDPDSVCGLHDTSASFSTCDLMAVSGFDFPSRQVDRDFDSTSSWKSGSDSSSSYTEASDCLELAQSLTDMSELRIKRTLHCVYSGSWGPCGIDTVLDGLRGRVTQIPKHFTSPFFKDFGKHTHTHDRRANEGILFHSQLKSHRSKYREGEEYCTLYNIQNGSYGDVFCIRDNSTGFECAAKRIALSHFNRHEVSTWSALNSPRVVELFGAVREGPNIILFMDLKPRCLAQLLREMGSLPEDLALHYMHQLLEALEHLHHRHIVHLDVKVDNVLLSANGMETFLCDFGLSETFEHDGRQTKAFRGSGFPGTETHMAPEVARGHQRCAKADVWSSCCMLLHMLNGCHPWIRYFSHPLCLKIVNEPPPLWEVPSNCNHFTAKMFRAGLQKDPDRRASARELRMKTTKALRADCGPHPHSFTPAYVPLTHYFNRLNGRMICRELTAIFHSTVGGLSHSSISAACERLYQGKGQHGVAMVTRATSEETRPTPAGPTMHWVSPWRTRAVDEDSGDWEEDVENVSDLDPDSDVERDFPSRELRSRAMSRLDSYASDDKDWETGSDSEVDLYMGEEEYARSGRGWSKSEVEYEGDWEEEDEEEWDSSSSTEYLRALRTHFPVLQRGQQAHCHAQGSEHELVYLRDGVAIGNGVQTPSPEPRDHPPSCCSCSDTSPIDAFDKDSDRWSDELSSGVFSSYNSQTDSHLEWQVTANQPSSYCFEGIDIWIEDIHGECLRIRERKQVKVGHVAIGISDQISAKSFSLETLDRKMVSYQQAITESGSWLRCVSAPDKCQRWSWRIKDGNLELRE